MKILNIIISLVNSEYNFKIPDKRDCIVYDFHSKKYLSKFLNIDDFYIFHCRLEKINFLILIITFFKSGYSDLKFNYFKNYIKFINPKVLITSIDNDYNFYRLKKYFNKVIFISIQNGRRNNLSFKKFSSYNNLSCDYLFCFNDSVKKIYKKYIKTEVIASGSIRNNFINKKINIKNKYKKNKNYKKRIAIVSQFSSFWSYRKIGEKGENIPFKDYYSLESMIYPKIRNICKKNKYKLFILGKSKNFENEKIFFNNIFKDKKNYKLLKYKNEENYIRIKKMDLIIASQTTFGLEALTTNKKVLILNRRHLVSKNKSMNILWPIKEKKEGIFWTESTNEKIIERKMNFILNMNKNTWKKKTIKYQKKLMIFDPYNRQFKKICKKYNLKYKD